MILRTNYGTNQLNEIQNIQKISDTYPINLIHTVNSIYPGNNFHTNLRLLLDDFVYAYQSITYHSTTFDGPWKQIFADGSELDSRFISGITSSNTGSLDGFVRQAVEIARQSTYGDADLKTMAGNPRFLVGLALKYLRLFI